MKVKIFLFSLAVMGLLLSAGCKHTKEEYSSVLTMDAEVVDIVYLSRPFEDRPSINMNDNIGLSVTSTQIVVADFCFIVLECEHGRFMVERSNKYKESQKTRQLWEHLEKRGRVVVTYREVYENTYDDNDKLIESDLIKYDFVDVEPK